MLKRVRAAYGPRVEPDNLGMTRTNRPKLRSFTFFELFSWSQPAKPKFAVTRFGAVPNGPKRFEAAAAHGRGDRSTLADEHTRGLG